MEMKIMSYIKKVKVVKPIEDHRADFNSHVRVDDDGCWRWTAGKQNIGYGMFRMQGKMRTSHRCMMMLEGHDIEDKIVYHTCDSYDCVNPDHLKVGVNQDKVAVMTSKKRAGTYWSDPKNYKTCAHCGYTGSPAPIAQYHNDNCKHKP
jgi:hypothetical protein